MGGVLVDRDLAWLAWLGRWRGATAEQLAAWWEPGLASGVKVAERRLRVWREMGLVSRMRVFADMPSVHSLTREGMTLVGLEGLVREPAIGTLRHDLAVIDCAAWLHGQAGPGDVMVTEREIRAADPATTTAPRWALPAAQGAGRRIVYPDLIEVLGSGKAVAHEVELAAKDQRRLVALMLSYVNSERIERVRYYGVDDAARERLERAAAAANRVGAAEHPAKPRKVFVTGWAWTGEVAA